MAASIQVTNTVGSRIQGIPKLSLSAAGGTDNLLRSQFLGSRRRFCTRATQVALRNVPKAGNIRSASFLEQLGRLFSAKDADQEQELAVFEINSGDRGSPVLLRLCPTPDAPLPTLGDLVPYTNKVFDASGKLYLGLSAGMCVVIENGNGAPSGVRFETTYTHYLGGYGQLSAMGPYYTNKDSEMVVTGGTGIFKGARGVVKLHSIVPPVKILYTYYITGIPKLPPALTGKVVVSVEEVPARQTPVTA